MGRSAKVVSGVAVSTRGANKRKRARLSRRACRLRIRERCSRHGCHYRSELALQRLSWRAVVIHQNFSNRRRKVIDPGAGHDDAVSASVSFLGDAQESPAVVFAELDVEMLTLDLQFSRLDDVIHFSLRPPSLGSETLKWKKNRQNLCNFLPAAVATRKSFFA